LGCGANLWFCNADKGENLTDYVTLLKNKELKATFQRMSILEVINRAGHMSVEAIFAEVSKVHPSLSLATVYKNIVLMVEKGVLVEVPITGKKSKYELAKEDHIHLVCTECGEVEDRPKLQEADRVLHTLTDEESFALHKQQINLYGVCRACQMEVAS
jgi:Fur family ferric uptake transcriptional regulator/Fur family peroxide stress response transcriptional regulator